LISNLKEISRRKDDPIKELKEMIDLHASYNSQKINAKIVFEDKHFLGKKFERITKDRQREIFEIYKTKLQEIASVGKLKDVNVTVINFSVLGIINWLYQWYTPDGKLSIKEIKDNIIKIIFSGVIKEDEKKQVGKKK
jgi:hypothetical protein